MALRDGQHACKHGSRVSKPLPSTRGLGAGTPTGAELRGHTLPPLVPIHEVLALKEGGDPSSDRTGEDAATLLHVARWSKDFLTNPHPALGRSGQVCPYVSAAIRERRFLLTVVRNAATATAEAEQTMLRLCEYFLSLEPSAGRLTQRKTIVTIFPDLPDAQQAELINGMHGRLKPHFLARGLMLGEFYADSEKPGLHDARFRPLRCATPLLVIRAMVPSDIAFLSDHAAFVRPFLDTFGESGCSEILSYIERERCRLDEPRIAMLLEQVAAVRAAESTVRQTSPPLRR